MKEKLSSMNEAKSPPKLYAWFASAFLITLIGASQLLPRGHYPNLRIIGVIMLLISPVFIFTPFFLLSNRKDNEDGKTYMEVRNIADNGLYAVVRHPQYSGYMMLAGGFAFLSQNPVILTLAIFSIICFYLQSLKEEQYCLDHFGKVYKDYLQRVPRFNIILGIFRVIRRKKSD